MIKNYLKIALRTLLKNKAFGFINITGLAIGISTCILITLYVLDELSYDGFHEKAERIYRVTEMLHLPNEDRPQAVTSPPMAPWLQANFAEIQKTVRLGGSSRLITYKDVKLYDTEILYTDSSFFDIFTFPMVAGNPQKALTQPYSIVLTENAVKKYFGNEEPMGKIMNFSDTIALTVTGIIKNIPSNSHLQFDVLLSRTTIAEMNNHQPEDNWFNNGIYTYILLPENYNYKNLEDKIRPALKKQMAEEKKQSGLSYDFVLQPLSDIHLKSTIPYDIGPNGNIKYVYTFSIVAGLILFIACANYINLSTARSLKRAKEVGMRKAIGAQRQQLMAQLIGESLLVTSIAFLLALAVINVVLPSFNLLTGKTLTFSLLFLQPKAVGITIGIFLTVGVLAGFYPALFISSFSPISALKNKLSTSKENGTLRKGLVVFQFTISIILIAGTVLIFRQMNFMQHQNLGLNKDQILQLKMRNTVRPKYELIRDEMTRLPGVTGATVTDFSYRTGISNMGMHHEGTPENESSSQAVISVDHNFLPLFEINLAAGRNFSKDFPNDGTENFIINEAAVKNFEWGTPEQALGKKIFWNGYKKGKVIGVVKDFNFYSLHETVSPLIIQILPDWYNYVSLKVKAGNISETIAQVEKKWKQLQLDTPIDYTFLDQDFQRMYQAEQRTQSIVSILSGLAIFIACLGLFGLAAFMAEQRTKEIGLRKVMGADVKSIVALLSKDFLVLVIVSIVIAIPLAWYAANQWLEGFAYKTTISWWIFALAGGSAILIALLTVSFQSIKAAIANPVDSLRNE